MMQSCHAQSFRGRFYWSYYYDGIADRTILQYLNQEVVRTSIISDIEKDLHSIASI